MSNRARKRRAGAGRAKGWRKELAAFDEQARQAEAEYRKRVATFSRLGLDPARVTLPVPVARPRRKRPGAGPALLAFWFSVPADVVTRRRGEPGYGSAPAARTRP